MGHQTSSEMNESQNESIHTDNIIKNTNNNRND